MRASRASGSRTNQILLYSDLMDSSSLFLTANSDTAYFITFVDLSNGPMVLSLPPLGPPTGILGAVDDMWFGWVIDIGVPGPDRGEGGQYLLVGPGYDGPLPDSGFHVSHSRTSTVAAFGRAFMIDNDPKIPADALRNGIKVYPYVPGEYGTAVATFLAGQAPLTPPQPKPETVFIEGSGVSFNTIPPNDFGYWELIDRLIQSEPAGTGDPEILGLLDSVGITKGKPFKPDDRMRKILEDAVVVGNATARTVAMDPRPDVGFAFYPGSHWWNMLFVGGYDFLNPPPQVTPQGVVPSPSDGARKINARIAFFYPYTGITPAMCMLLSGMGSQYLMAMRDGAGEYFDGALTYRLNLPPDIPQTRFWSLMAYDRQTRSMLQTGQPKPDVGSQSGTVQTNPDGSTDILSVRPPPREKRATGFKPCLVRGGSRSSGSITRCLRSLTSRGDRARSNRCKSAPVHCPPATGARFLEPCREHAPNVASAMSEGF
jgi:hypothetical protein